VSDDKKRKKHEQVQCFLGDKPVGEEAFLRHLERPWLDEIAAENAIRIQESGVRAAEESNADSTWFQSWAERELPDLLAQGQLKALNLFEEQQEKKENTLPARLRRYASGLISGVILTILSILVAWAMGLVGFK
jgi:hypothetical protein